MTPGVPLYELIGAGEPILLRLYQCGHAKGGVPDRLKVTRSLSLGGPTEVISQGYSSVLAYRGQ